MRTTSSRTRRITIAALSGTTALAVIGGAVLTSTAAHAATSSTYTCTTSNGGTALVDFAGTGNGLINLGSTGGLVGVATGSNGVQVGLLGCTIGVGIGSTSGGATAEILTGTPTVPTTTPTVPTDTTPTAPATTPTAAPEATATAATPAVLDDLEVSKSFATVYPAAKGYKNTVTFRIKGLTSTDSAVKVTGKAVLKKGTKVVKTWKISAATTKLTWNGKVGKKVRAGVYTLKVKAWSANGSTRTETMKVRVSAKHLVTRTASMRTRDLSKASTDTLPKAVQRAFKYGAVTLRIHTVAKVSGPANLVITGPNGGRISIPLKDGRHVTKSATLPKGFTSATFTHDWKQGDATLKDLYTVFTYKALV